MNAIFIGQGTGWNAPKTGDGRPLIPSAGDIVFKLGVQYRVEEVVWDYDELIVRVFIKEV